MRSDGFAAAALALTLLWGCASAPPPKKPLPPPPRTVSAEQRTEIDRDYFLAVSAYTRGDYAQSLGLVKRILALEPSNPDAVSLRRRIMAAQKAGGP
ncbi:MAG: hypothetical protein HY077_17985 [Elusimicrobia bacterium]|nr:hypothetical protein [Elusimicrobiota bacterium]